MKNESIKRKHHFVSQFYLKAWSLDSEKIYASKKEMTSSPFLVRTCEIALANYFYKVHPLSEESLKYLYNFVKNTHSADLPIYKLIISTINEIQEKLSKAKAHFHALDQEIPFELENDEKIFKTNILENYYGHLESKFSVLIKKIIEGKAAHLTVNDYDILLFFVTSQFIRTQKKLQSSQQTLIKQLPKLPQEELNTLILYLGLIMDQKIHSALTNSLYLITIVKNKTQKNLITSDNPVINIKFKETNNKELEYIVPISPKFYLHIKQNMYSEEINKSLIESFKADSKQLAFNKTIILESTENISQIEWINKLIFKESQRFLYGLDKLDLIYKNE
ncbi:DUF4238 domain-containing protein [Acinetobacter venetianus]|uniref:DUF4238 domain-containing protein n=1 Tax=Acinetobacter venetianus TaxID=52133 RepID=UPI0013EE674E|nr:DUF4238 domain-containing protein [Acinetobacter venetianus]